MAITFDTFFTTDGTSSGTPDTTHLTKTGTIGSGANQLLVVSAYCRDTVVNGVTWNSVTLTNAVDVNSADALYAGIYYVVAPATGTHDLVMSFAASTPTYCGATVHSLFGIDQANPLDDVDQAQTTGGTSLQLSALTTIADGCAVVDAFACNLTSVQGANMTPETNRVLRGDFLCDPQERAVCSSTLIIKTPAGSVTMQWNPGGGFNGALAAAAFKPAAGEGLTGTGAYHQTIIRRPWR